MLQNKKFINIKNLIIYLFFIILVFIQGCGKSILNREKAAKIIAQSLYPPVIVLKKKHEYNIKPNEEVIQMVRELKKIGINASLSEKTTPWGEKFYYFESHIDTLPQQWQSFLMGESKESFYLVAYEKVNVEILGIAFNEAKNEAEVDFRWRWYNPTELAQIASKYEKFAFSPLRKSPYFYDENKDELYFCSKDKGEGRAIFKLYDDGWKVYRVTVSSPPGKYTAEGVWELSVKR
jgi:hypothetical protein